MSTETTPTTLKKDLSNWDPENAATWDSKLAWRTLSITTYALMLGFSTWYLVSAIAPRLNEIGFNLTDGQLYWLAAMPGLAAGVSRFLLLFLPPIIGTRNLVVYNTLFLLIPMGGWAMAVQDPTTSYAVLIMLAIASGIAGGSFSGFMASTSYFFPKRLQGTALGLQAGIGNFGIGLVQFLIPWVIGFGLLGTSYLPPQEKGDGALIWLHNAGLVLIPWAVLAVVLAVVYLRRVPVKANFREQFDIFRLKHTWIMTALYMMSFGLYSGLAAQMGLIIRSVYGGFEDGPNPLAFAFIGPLLGAVIRALCGPLCDKFGGAIFTFIGGIGMTAGTVVTAFFLSPSSVDEFWGFLTGMLIIFFFAGFTNAGTFKQMPMIFPKRQAGGAIGWTAALAAFGPFIVGVSLSMINPTSFFIGCAVFCAICTWLAWHYYTRRNAEMPS